MLLYFSKSEDVREVCRLYCERNSYEWKLMPSANVHASGTSLMIKSRYEPFPWQIGRDLFHPKTWPKIFDLRFALSSTDCEVLREKNMFSNPEDIAILDKIIDAKVAQRKKALIGTYLLSDLHLVFLKPTSHRVGTHFIMLALSEFESENAFLSSTTHELYMNIADKLCGTDLWINNLRNLSEEIPMVVYEDISFPAILQD